MVSGLQLNLPMDRLRDYCAKWTMIELALFGSVLRKDFSSDSDVDVLVSFAPEARWGLLDLVEAEQELAALLGRPVDLVERQCVESSSNWIRRRHILENARTVYVA